MTVVLMVISGMDPHTIRVTWVGMIEMFKSVSLVLRLNYRSGLCGILMSRFEEKSF
jgi:hypothetical protein